MFVIIVCVYDKVVGRPCPQLDVQRSQTQAPRTLVTSRRSGSKVHKRQFTLGKNLGRPSFRGRRNVHLWRTQQPSMADAPSSMAEAPPSVLINGGECPPRMDGCICYGKGVEASHHARAMASYGWRRACSECVRGGRSCVRRDWSMEGRIFWTADKGI